jgi:AcrR family transcriptional regulator
MTLTRAALRAAGFPVPEPEAPGPPHATGQDPPGPTAAGLPDRERQSDQGDRALIAYLERALEEARERERRLLDLVAHLTGQRSALPAGAPPPSAVRPAAAARPPLSGVRQQIVAVVRQYPEGLSPQAARTLLHVDKDLRATMKGMVRSGILTRRAAGRYVVAPGW